MCKQAHARAGLTFRFRRFGIFRDVRTFVSCLLTIFRKHMLGLSPFPLVLYSFKPQEVYLLVLYTLVIFPSVSVLRFRRKSILYMRFGPETVTHNVIAFFSAKFPQLVENSRVSSLATIPATIVVITHILRFLEKESFTIPLASFVGKVESHEVQSHLILSDKLGPYFILPSQCFCHLLYAFWAMADVSSISILTMLIKVQYHSADNV